VSDAIVIGGGISGLVAAHRLSQSGDVLLFEASERAGGVIQTREGNGFLVELGPNSVRMTDEIDALVRELDLEEDLVTGDPRAPRYVYHRGRLVRAPMGPASLVTSSLLSFGAKLRLLGEPFARAPGGGEEPTLEAFVTRRLGREVHDVLVSAFVSGVYAGDTRRLSAEAIVPSLVAFEREHGSVVRGGIAAFRRKRREAKAAAPAAAPGGERAARPRRRGMTISSFRGGLSRLPERIAEALGERARLGTPVEGVERRDGTWIVEAGGERVETSRLVVATPADTAAALLAPHAPRLATLLDEIEYAPLVSVALAYERERVAHACDGFGFLAPRGAGLRTLGAIFGASLFPGRAPDGWHSFTCFVGGATDPEAIALDDDAIVDLVAGDLERAVGARGEPRVLTITRWRRAIPQYTIGHPARVGEIEREAAALGVELLGNYLHGVSVGDCVAAAMKIQPNSRG
jgi:oxygen-dependent protoporphyrinogen oxidase